MADKTMIEISNVTQSFLAGDETIQVIRRADFSIKDNSFNIIYGPSGSGKSTLLNIISGLQRPTSGTVKVEGRDIYTYRPDELANFRANRIGIVYQTNYWVSSLNTLENVALPLNFLGYSRPTAEKLAKQTLERVGMGAYAKKSPLLLSGGEQQRIAMARALASTPLFIIADEPTGNLDAANGDKIIELLQSCQKDFHCTIVLVTHNIEYLPLGDAILHIEDGKVVQSSGDTVATTDQLLAELKTRLDQMKRVKK